MGLDIKLPIGLFFILIGIIITISGLFYKQEVIDKLGFNFNLIWGLVMFAFGLVMLGMYLMTKRKS